MDPESTLLSTLPSTPQAVWEDRVRSSEAPSLAQQTPCVFDPDGELPPDSGATVPGTMTAKEQLLQRVQTLSEDEAAETLRLLDQRTEDPVIAAFRDAPLDDEPWTEEDEQAAAEGRADLAAGRTVSLEEAMREFE